MKIVREKTLFLPVVLFVFISLSIRGQNNPENCFHLMRTQPYLQMPGTNSMVVRWVTAFPCTGEIEYSKGSTFTEVIRVSSTDASLIHKFKLTNLDAATKYYYRVRSTVPACNGEPEKTELSGIHSFTTINPKTTDYKILVLNDLHPRYPQFWDHYENGPVYEKIQEIIDILDYDLTVFNGDNLDDFHYEGDMVWWIDHFNRWVRNDAIPSVYLMGNHEYDGPLGDTLKHIHRNPALKDYLDFVKDGQTYGKIQINQKTELLFLDTGQTIDGIEHNKDDPEDIDEGIDLCKYFTDLYEAQYEFVRDSISPDKTKNRVLFHHIALFGNETGVSRHYNALQAEELNKANILLSVNGHGHLVRAESKNKWRADNSKTPIQYPIFLGDGPPSNPEKNPKYFGSVTLLHLKESDIELTCYLIKADTYKIEKREYDVEQGIITLKSINELN